MKSLRSPVQRLAQRAFAVGLGVAPCLAVAQFAPPDEWLRAPAVARIGYETITLPGEERLGLVGTTYLIEVRPGLCVGPAVYGAASGQRGGFFTLGAEATLCTRLVGPLSLQAGLYVGGGGGGAAPVGGGLMLRPHVDLLWDFGAFRAGIAASKVRFPNGQIDSSQLGVVFDMELDFRYWPVGRTAMPWTDSGRTGMGVNRYLAVGGAYLPRSGSTGVSGAALPSQIGYVGARAEALLAPNVYVGLETNGAASGGVDGYAEFLGTLGVEVPLGHDWFALGGRVALGMGGGGDVPVGGGLLAKAAFAASVRLSRDISLGLEAGWAYAPQGSFSAPFASLALRWALDPAPGQPGAVVREHWGAGVETFHDAARKVGPSESLQSVSFKYTRFLGETLYLTGQVQSAYAGDAGAFIAGLFGGGGQWRLGEGLLAGAELLVGAAGGGGVDTGGGAVVKPMAFVGVEMTPALSLRLGAGWVKAVKGGLDSPVLDLTMVFAFGVAGRP